MADIIPLSSRRPTRRQRAADKRGRALCQHGHHDWQVDQGNPFDVARGRLITAWTCRRCGAVRNEAT